MHFLLPTRYVAILRCNNDRREDSLITLKEVTPVINDSTGFTYETPFVHLLNLKSCLAYSFRTACFMKTVSVLHALMYTIKPPFIYTFLGTKCGI